MTKQSEEFNYEAYGLRLRIENPTGRPCSEGLEVFLDEEIAIKVLDHGFVRVVDYMGNDDSIVQAARVSYGKGTKSVQDDRGLIRYLMRHRHTTPFEMCEIKLHIKLPIFVARQLIRHRTASVNEISARYSILDKEFYLPEPEVLAEQSRINNQGRGVVLEEAKAFEVLDILRNDAMNVYGHYERFLGDEYKLARELARMDLTLNYYTQWYWKTNLHNLLHFLTLRLDTHAQYEIRMYAEAMATIAKNWVPMAYDAFEDYRLGAVTLSKHELSILKECLHEEKLALKIMDKGNIILSKREKEELLAKFGLVWGEK